MTDLSDTYYGQTAMLVGGAPSLSEQPLRMLEQRGVLTMAMNNAALHFQPTLWCGVDRPECFDPQIMLDPRIMKFGNFYHARVKLDQRYGQRHYSEFPNTFFFIPESDVPWDEFLAPRRGIPWYNNTLFTSIYILYHLGVRRIVLAGSDFSQSKGGAMYAHKTDLNSLEVKWNVDLYNGLVYELRRMRPIFDRLGLEFYDCSVYSRIDQAYDKISMERAVELCLDGYPAQPLPAGTLPHCSKFATESIQDRIAKWPGYTVAGKEQATPDSSEPKQFVL